MKKVAKFGILALLLVTLVASAFAFRGFGFGNKSAREALEAGDYTAWKEAMTAELTEERFNQMRERYTQMENKTVERKVKMEERQSAINAACEAGDIDQLTDLELPMADKLVITEDNFETFCEFQSAMQDKDFEKVKELAEELGLNGLGRGFGGKIGYRGGFRPKMGFE